MLLGCGPSPPNLRGFGGTRFRDSATPRTGDSSVLAYDAIDLMEALGVGQFFVAGHDWGSNAAEALAVGWPERVPKIAMLSTPSRLGGMPTPPFPQCQRQWYHWFQATKRGAKAVHDDPKGFSRIMWDNWSPPGCYDEATFDAVARSWDNPDWADVTVHSYRARWDEAEPDPRSAPLEQKIKTQSASSHRRFTWAARLMALTRPRPPRMFQRSSPVPSKPSCSTVSDIFPPARRQTRLLPPLSGTSGKADFIF